MAKKIHKVSPLRPTLLRRTIAIASTHCLCLAFFHSSFIKYSRTSHKKRLRIIGHAAQRNDAAQMKFIMELWVSDRMEMIIAWYRSQGSLLPIITASIDTMDHYERPVWIAAEIRDNNIAIGSFYRSGDVTTTQHIQSVDFVFVEIKFTHIKQLRKSSHI